MNSSDLLLRNFVASLSGPSPSTPDSPVQHMDMVAPRGPAPALATDAIDLVGQERSATTKRKRNEPAEHVEWPAAPAADPLAEPQWPPVVDAPPAWALLDVSSLVEQSHGSGLGPIQIDGKLDPLVDDRCTWRSNIELAEHFIACTKDSKYEGYSTYEFLRELRTFDKRGAPPSQQGALISLYQMAFLLMDESLSVTDEHLRLANEFGQTTRRFALSYRARYLFTATFCDLMLARQPELLAEIACGMGADYLALVNMAEDRNRNNCCAPSIATILSHIGSEPAGLGDRLKAIASTPQDSQSAAARKPRPRKPRPRKPARPTARPAAAAPEVPLPGTLQKLFIDRDSRFRAPIQSCVGKMIECAGADRRDRVRAVIGAYHDALIDISKQSLSADDLAFAREFGKSLAAIRPSYLERLFTEALVGRLTTVRIDLFASLVIGLGARKFAAIKKQSRNRPWIPSLPVLCNKLQTTCLRSPQLRHMRQLRQDLLAMTHGDRVNYLPVSDAPSAALPPTAEPPGIARMDSKVAATLGPRVDSLLLGSLLAPPDLPLDVPASPQVANPAHAAQPNAVAIEAALKLAAEEVEAARAVYERAQTKHKALQAELDDARKAAEALS